MLDMQSDRLNCSLLGQIALNKFTYRQTKQIQSLEHRTVLSSDQIPSNKYFQITFLHNFSSDVLITNFQIQLNDEKMFDLLFHYHSAEANSMSYRGNYISMLNIKVEKTQKSLIINSFAYSQSIKLILNLRKDFTTYLPQLKKQLSKSIQQQNIQKTICSLICSVKLHGFSLHSNPPAPQLTLLLNISQCFKKNDRYQQQAQTDVLLALCLINARRFIQASELLRKASRFFVTRYTNSKEHLENTKYDRTWMRQNDEHSNDTLNMSRNYSTGRVLEGAKYLFKAAKIQLLLAETITHPSLINQKLQAYNRSNSYFNGNARPNSLEPSADIQQILSQVGPNLITFLMKVLFDKTQILRITALKSIQFIFQTLGCTLSHLIPQILKTILLTYPSCQPYHAESISAVQQIPLKNKALIDSYHHLLETFLGLLPLMNKKYCRAIFKDIITPNIPTNAIRNQLKLYLLRFSQKIVLLCGADLQINMQFISTIIALAEKKFVTSNSTKYTIHNISFFSQRIIQMVRNKILPRYDNQHLASLCVYINQNLVYFCENEITAQNHQFFGILLDLIMAIYQNKKKTKIVCPIQPVIYFLNLSINQSTLPFDKLLQTTIILLKYIQIKDQHSEINHQIVSRIMAKSKLSTLSIKQLNILQQFLKTFASCEIQWLSQYLNCIPHSTFDQTYAVFNILFNKSLYSINKVSLQKIIDTLLDQYTVKGKAHQSSKNQMIDLILTKNKSLIKSIIEICLIDNHQPNFKHYQARKKRNQQHNVDTKMYKIHCQLFIQKIQLLLLFLNRLNDKSKDLYDIMTTQMIKQIYVALKKVLQSKSSKIKQKSLRIVKSLIQTFGDNIKQMQHTDLTFTKSILSLLKSFISTKLQLKLHYQAILNIFFLFSKVLKTKSNVMDSMIQSSSQFQLLDANFDANSDLPIIDNLDVMVPELKFRQFHKIYSSLVFLLNSPWENIRQIILFFILHFFSQGLITYSIPLQTKAVQLLRPLISSFVQSTDHVQRLNACKIVGCLLGLSRDFKSRDQMQQSINKCSKFIRPFLNDIFQLQEDWHELVRRISRMIIKCTLSAEQQQILHKKISLSKRSQQIDNSYCTFNLGQQYNFQKNYSSFSLQNIQNLQMLLKQSSNFQQIQQNQSFLIQIDENLQNQIGYFKTQIQQNNNLKLSFFIDKQSFIDREEEHYFQPNQDKDNSHQDNHSNKSQQQPLEFQDLGIIDLDDQEWGQEETQVAITQKLPFKKIYKLSPNVATSNKHQRIRSKRYFSHQFDQIDKIIVDQLQGRINHEDTAKFQQQKSSKFQQQKSNKFQQQKPGKFQQQKLNKCQQQKSYKFQQTKSNNFKQQKWNKFQQIKSNSFKQQKWNKFEQLKPNKFQQVKSNKFQQIKSNNRISNGQKRKSPRKLEQLPKMQEQRPFQQFEQIQRPEYKQQSSQIYHYKKNDSMISVQDRQKKLKVKKSTKKRKSVNPK